MNLNGFIVGGVEANPHSLPWQVKFDFKFPDGEEGKCGGSIIGSKYIISAAHCFLVEDEDSKPGDYATYQKPSSIVVWAGMHDDSYKTSKYIQKRTVSAENVIIHPDYNDGRANLEVRANDIAIIKLEKELEFTDGVRPICLPNANQEYSEGTTFLASGWGNTKYGVSSSGSRKLKQVFMKFVNLDDCKKELYHVRDHYLCAKGAQAGGDTCQGDSGGPLITRTKSRQWILSGVTSWGLGCGKSAGVYTSVAKFISWIKENTK